jgi:hypothetical protein
MARWYQKSASLAASIAVLTLLIGTPGRAAALTGKFSCLGSTIFGVTFAKGGPVFPEILTELITLNLSPAGARGNLVVGYIGEVCNFTLSAVSVTTTASGQGTLKLTFNPNIGDVDKDPKYKCGQQIYGRTTTVTQNYLISVFNLGKGFFFHGNDDFLSPNAGDNADFFTPSGQCIQQ